jgi:hypothetical protein
MTNSKQKRDESSPEDHLPARSVQSTALLEAPKEGLKLAVEQGAQAYFSTCRRLARLLNRNKD